MIKSRGGWNVLLAGPFFLKHVAGELRCRGPYSCYVKGCLQPTYSLGDAYLKYPYFNNFPGRVIAEPYKPPYIRTAPQVPIYIYLFAYIYIYIYIYVLYTYIFICIYIHISTYI